VERYTRISPMLKHCCLRLSATESYQQAELDLFALTGIHVGHSDLHRWVQQTELDELELEETIEEVSLDGGKVRVRTPKGEPSEWRDYKAVRLNGRFYESFFQQNAALVQGLQMQPLACLLVCLGDGHAGIWKLFAEVVPDDARFEILDWYHLKENLFKVEAERSRLEQAETYLWQGQVDAAVELFAQATDKSALNFCAYVQAHRGRLIDYQQFQSDQLCSIGSGAVESAVKQIDRRLKVSGAQWKRENVNQMLKLRCAYLNQTLAA
jgi:hypothetical protein